MPRKEPNTTQISAQAQQDLVSDGIENFELPKSLVTKIAKSAIPESSKLQKETVLSLVKGSTVFINYLAATAHDVAISKQHKSISASDVLKALEMIEFGDLVEKLQTELLVYREQAKTDKSKRGSANITSASSASTKTRPVAAGAGALTGAGAGSAVAAASTSGVGVAVVVSAPTPGPGAVVLSAPTPSSIKLKGKERSEVDGQILPSPFTSAPLVRPVLVGESVSSGLGGQMEVDWEEEEEVGEMEGDVDEVEDAEVEDAEVMEDAEVEVPIEEGDEDDEGEGEVLDDPMEVEEEELRGDERGLDGHEDPHGDT